MIYKFRSKVGADVIMLGPHGDHLLDLLGRAPSARGILEPAQMAEALARLQDAIEAEAQAADVAADDELADDKARGAGDGVSLRRRLWPMIEMIRAALAADEVITWGV